MTERKAGGLFPGALDTTPENPSKFPFDAFTFNPNTPALTIRSPWTLTVTTGINTDLLITKVVRAKDTNGLKLLEDSSTYGLTIKDDGNAFIEVLDVLGIETTDLENWHANYGAIEFSRNAIMWNRQAAGTGSDMYFTANAYFSSGGTWKRKMTEEALYVGMSGHSGGAFSIGYAVQAAGDTDITWSTRLNLACSGAIGLSVGAAALDWSTSYRYIDLDPYLALMTYGDASYFAVNAFVNSSGNWTARNANPCGLFHFDCSDYFFYFNFSPSEGAGDTIAWQTEMAIGRNSGGTGTFLYLGAKAGGTTRDVYVYYDTDANWQWDESANTLYWTGSPITIYEANHWISFDTYYASLYTVIRCGDATMYFRTNEDGTGNYSHYFGFDGTNSSGGMRAPETTADSATWRASTVGSYTAFRIVTSSLLNKTNVRPLKTWKNTEGLSLSMVEPIVWNSLCEGDDPTRDYVGFALEPLKEKHRTLVCWGKKHKIKDDETSELEDYPTCPDERTILALLVVEYQQLRADYDTLQQRVAALEGS